MNDEFVHLSLEECQEEIRRLREENRHLRESSRSFGDLAERLTVALDRERRTGVDRRQTLRQGPERRSPDLTADRN